MTVYSCDNHAYVELKAEDGSLAEVIPYDIGFRRIEIIDKIIYLNGKRLIITGVNRHEWNPKTGRCIGLEDMRADTFMLTVTLPLTLS